MLRSASLLSAFLLAQAGCFMTDSGSSQNESESSGSEDVGGDDVTDDGGDAEDDGDGDDGEDDDCEKIENEAIGAEVSLELGSVTVSFSDWIAKEDSPGEFVGFTLTLEGDDSISYRVKAGGEVLPSAELVWLHPAGTTGSEAHGISNVEVCDGGEDDGGEDDGGEDDSGEDDSGEDDGDDGGEGDGGEDDGGEGGGVD